MSLILEVLTMLCHPGVKYGGARTKLVTPPYVNQALAMLVPLV